MHTSNASPPQNRKAKSDSFLAVGGACSPEVSSGRPVSTLKLANSRLARVHRSQLLLHGSNSIAKVHQVTLLAINQLDQARSDFIRCFNWVIQFPSGCEKSLEEGILLLEQRRQIIQIRFLKGEPLLLNKILNLGEESPESLFT